MIPTPYKIIAVILILLGMLAYAEYDGAQRVKAKWDAEKAAQVISALKVETKQAEASVQVVTKYIDRIIKVKDNASGYQQAPITDNCRLSGSWRVLHDSAALNQPYSSNDAYAAAPDIEAITAARLVASNYAACNQNSEQLSALQDWVIKTQEANK